MIQFWNLLTILLFVHYSTTLEVSSTLQSCEVDSDRSKTVHNLKYNCNRKELKIIFSNLTAGTFPPNGKLKGSVLIKGMQDQIVWNGKKMKYLGGSPPHDHGTLVNMFFNRYEMFNADVYRTMAPIDGNTSFVLNYRHTSFVFCIVDYIREVQKNVYLGIMTIRPFNKIPVLYFLLEKA